MLEQGFKIGNADVESPSPSRRRQLRFRKSLPMWPLANMGAAADRIDEVLAPYAKLNYEKHLKDAQNG